MAKETGDRKQGNAGVVESVLKVELPLVPEGAGRYANYMVITYSENEFSLDFWHAYPVAPSQGAATFLFRAIVSPRFIKRIQRALEINIAKYEQNFGVLPEPPKTPDRPQPRSVKVRQ